VQQERFDVVLMDVMMPQMTGLEATRAIRTWEQDHGGHIPIIAMTAHAMKGAREDCLRAGMDEHLSKPIQVAHLFRIMEQMTGGACERTTEPTPVKPSPTGEPDGFDPGPLLQRISGDRGLLQELVAMCGEDCPRMLEHVRTAIDADDAEAVRRAAHLLKGSVSNVVSAAQRLEEMGREGELREARNAYQSLEESLSAFRTALEEWLAAQPA
jgi:CheY-like chemotaxis protein